MHILYQGVDDLTDEKVAMAAFTQNWTKMRRFPFVFIMTSQVPAAAVVDEFPLQLCPAPDIKAGSTF